MKKNFISFILAISIFILCVPIVPVNANVAGDDYVPNQVIVKLRERLIRECADNSRTIDGLYAILDEWLSDKVPVVDMESINPPVNNGLESLGQTYFIQDIPEADENQDQPNSIHDDLILLTIDGNQLSVEQAVEILHDSEIAEYAEPNHYYYYNSVVPNEYDNMRLWGKEKIKMPQAWELSTGSREIVVGVVDSGIEADHEDLKDNIWKVPEGGNGYPGNKTIVSDHGTHVAGIIGAVGNNGKGGCGINWNISLADLNADNGSGMIDLAKALSAISYANDMNIPILNNSYGAYFYDRSLYDKIKEYKGLFIASAGNESNDNDSKKEYPASYDLDNIISVANSDYYDRLHVTSNYGKNSVDLAAPGTSIYSTVLKNSYDYKSGTSMAAPQVTGVAALILSVYPDLTTTQLKERLLNNVDKVFSGKLATDGRLNAYRAMTAFMPYLDMEKELITGLSTALEYEYWDAETEDYLPITLNEDNQIDLSPFISYIDDDIIDVRSKAKGDIPASRPVTFDLSKDFEFGLDLSREIMKGFIARRDYMYSATGVSGWQPAHLVNEEFDISKLRQDGVDVDISIKLKDNIMPTFSITVPRRNVPELNLTKEVIAGLSPAVSYEYRFEGETEYRPAAAVNSEFDISPFMSNTKDVVLELRACATDTLPPSQIDSIVLPKRPLLELDLEKEAVKNLSIRLNYEYRLQGETEYKPAAVVNGQFDISPFISDTADVTLEIKQYTNGPEPISTVFLLPERPDAPVTPYFTLSSGGSMIVDGHSDMEYCTNEQPLWRTIQDNNFQLHNFPDKDVVYYVRYKGKGDHTSPSKSKKLPVIVFCL